MTNVTVFVRDAPPPPTPGLSVSEGTLGLIEGNSGGEHEDLYGVVNRNPDPDGVGVTASVTVMNPRPDTVSVSPTSLSFTAADWNEPKPVTVSALADQDATDEQVTLTFALDGNVVAATTVPRNGHRRRSSTPAPGYGRRKESGRKNRQGGSVEYGIERDVKYRCALFLCTDRWNNAQPSGFLGVHRSSRIDLRSTRLLGPITGSFRVSKLRHERSRPVTRQRLRTYVGARRKTGRKALSVHRK